MEKRGNLTAVQCLVEKSWESEVLPFRSSQKKAWCCLQARDSLEIFDPIAATGNAEVLHRNSSITSYHFNFAGQNDSCCIHGANQVLMSHVLHVLLTFSNLHLLLTVANATPTRDLHTLFLPGSGSSSQKAQRQDCVRA